jgi:Mrp family chromosome partitioning ATPase
LSVNLSTDPRQELGRPEEQSWINPTAEKGGISQYLEAIRGDWWLIIVAVIACVGATLLILSRSEKTYEATAFVVISPVSDREGSFAGLSILRDSNDPARNLETLAKVITTPAVATRVKAITKVQDTPRELLRGVQVVPVAQSDLLAITASSSSPRFAQRLANAFAEATVRHRTTQLHTQVDRLIAGLRPLVRRQRGRAADRQDRSQRVIAERLAQLEALRIGPDPTVRLETSAELPRAPASPKPALSIAVSLIAGLLTGLAAVFGMQLLDPRVRSERQLRELYRLPVLARIPKVRDRLGRHHESRATIAQNSYQSLRVALIGAGGGSGSGRSIMLTGPSAKDGKTTTAIGLARTFANTGQRATLIEADARRPSIGKAMGVTPSSGLLGVMSGSSTMSEALVHPEGEVESLNVLLVEQAGGWLPDVLIPTTADRLLTELDETSDWIIIDSPPLGRVIDALPLAILADQLLLVVRLGKSQVSELKRLTDTLDQYSIRPTGFVLIGAQQRSYYG